MRLVVDTSVLIAIRAGEPEREAFHQALLRAEPLLSAATLAELTMVWQARYGADDLAHLERLLALYRIRVEPVLSEDAPLLRQAIVDYGRGRGAEPAVLNLGDLFGYVLARRLGVPLLFKGNDFSRTDITPVS